MFVVLLAAAAAAVAALHADRRPSYATHSVYVFSTSARTIQIQSSWRRGRERIEIRNQFSLFLVHTNSLVVCVRVSIVNIVLLPFLIHGAYAIYSPKKIEKKLIINWRQL